MAENNQTKAVNQAGFEIYDSRPWLKYFSGTKKPDIDMAAGYQSYGEMVSDASRTHGKNPAFTTCLPAGISGTLSFDKVEKYSNQFAAYLRFTLNLKKGDRVAIQSPNCLAYPIFLFGAAKAGCAIVNINPLYTPAEMEFALKDSGAKLLLIIDMFANKLEKVLPHTEVKTVLLHNIAEFFPPLRKWLVKTVQRRKKMLPPCLVPHVAFASALENGEAQLAEGRSPIEWQVRLDDLLALQYTGGTTGRPKGAMLTHRNLVANGAQSFNNLQQNLVPNLVAMTPLPMYHIFALGVCGVLYRVGAHNILIPSPRPVANLRKAFEKFNIQFMCGVNTLYAGLLNEEWFRQHPPQSLKTAIGGGAAIQDAVAIRWKEVVGERLIQGYGLTETSPTVTTNPIDGPEKLGSIGLPGASTYVRIVDDQGNAVPLGERGELIVKGPQVMTGYWQQPDETAIALRDGWLYTGDIATMDDDGFFYIVDRKKDMVLVSGFNVYPTEVEEVLAKHPGILEAGVVGVPNEETGEAVIAYVVKRDAALSEADIRKHCREFLTPYKIPKSVIFASELPKTPVGKILRKDLRAQALQEMGK